MYCNSRYDEYSLSVEINLIIFTYFDSNSFSLFVNYSLHLFHVNTINSIYSTLDEITIEINFITR